eukprot:gene14694-20733_t
MQAEHTAPNVIKRLRLMDEHNRAMAALKEPAVKERYLELLKGMPAVFNPTTWWSMEADLCLQEAVDRHGYGNCDADKSDKDYANASAPEKL